MTRRVRTSKWRTCILKILVSSVVRLVGGMKISSPSAFIRMSTRAPVAEGCWHLALPAGSVAFLLAFWTRQQHPVNRRGFWHLCEKTQHFPAVVNPKGKHDESNLTICRRAAAPSRHSRSHRNWVFGFCYCPPGLQFWTFHTLQSSKPSAEVHWQVGLTSRTI